jgi:hypothetical protein
MLALFVGLLLPLPLIWGLGAWLPGRLTTSTQQGGDRHLVPRLSPEEKRQVPTFMRACRQDADCDAPLVCVKGILGRQPACAASECGVDTDCEEGFSCRALAVGHHVVRMCAADGEAKAGEKCMTVPLIRKLGCEQGLRCAGRLCGRACRPESPQSCPEGFFCGATEEADGPACLPTCEARTCPEGQQCVQVGQGASVCARVPTMNCQREPCPAGQVCDVERSIRQRGVVWMKCAQPCERQNPSCPEGFVCAFRHCSRTCEPGVADACGPGQRCTQVEGYPPICMFGSSP